MARWVGLVVFMVVLSGCAPVTMMVNPRTGDVQQCRTTEGVFYDWLDLFRGHAQCVEQLRGLGYKASGELTPEERGTLINPKVK